MQSFIVLVSLVSELAGGGGGIKMTPLVLNVTKNTFVKIKMLLRVKMLNLWPLKLCKLKAWGRLTNQFFHANHMLAIFREPPPRRRVTMLQSNSGAVFGIFHLS